MSKTFDNVEKRLVDKLYSAYQIDKGKILDTINLEIVRMFLFMEKYDLIHDYDPPWDCSGLLINTHKNFVLDNYEKVGDFLEEYNGNMIATYMSGLGFVPETFRDNIKDIIDRETKKILAQTVQELEPEHVETLKEALTELLDEEEFDDDIAGAILFTDFIGDEIIELSNKILEDVEEQPFKDVAEKYSAEVVKVQEKYLAELEEASRKQELEKAVAEETWEKIKELYRHYYNKEIPQKVEKGVEYEKLKSLLNVADEISEEDIRKVGKYLGHFFSNSVAFELTKFVRQAKFERFHNRNDTLVICDPVYFNTEHRLVINNVAKGVWYISTNTFKDKYGVYVSSILALHESCINANPGDINTWLGDVDVDTATLGMYFGGIFEEEPDSFLTSVILQNSIYTKTGWGDGTYEVFGRKNKNHKIVAVMIRFV